MPSEELNIDYELLASYFSGELTSEQRAMVDAWVARSTENEALFEDCRVIFSLNFIETNNAPSFSSNVAWNQVAAKAGILADDTKSIQFEPEVDSGPSIPWLRIAAVIIIGIAAVFYLFIKPADSTTLTASNEIQNFILPDSSRVTLNIGTSLTYDNDFGSTHRDLDLEGEAYFDVTKKDLVFSVETELGTVEVLGTAFGVTSNPDSLTVIVQRGKVSVRSLEDADIQVILERNEKAVLRENKIEKSQLRSTNDLYWANQTLTYRRMDLENVFNELESVFNKNIEFDALEIQDCQISAVFRDETIESILENMALSMNFEYTISGDTVNISSNGCQK